MAGTLYPVSQYRCVLPDHPQDQEFAGQATRSTRFPKFLFACCAVPLPGYARKGRDANQRAGGTWPLGHLHAGVQESNVKVAWPSSLQAPFARHLLSTWSRSDQWAGLTGVAFSMLLWEKYCALLTGHPQGDQGAWQEMIGTQDKRPNDAACETVFIWPSPSIQTWYVLMYWSTVYTCNVIDVISHNSMSSRTFGAVFPKETSSLLWYVSPSNFATLNAWLRSVCGMERVPALCAESTWSSDHRKAVAGIRLTVSSALLVVSIDDLLQLNVESWTLVVSLSFCDWIWTNCSAQCLKCVSVFFGPYKNARDSPTCVLKTCLIWCCFDSPGSAFYICWTKIVCCKSRTGRAETGACICIYLYIYMCIYICIYIYIFMYVCMHVCMYVSMYISIYV